MCARVGGKGEGGRYSRRGRVLSKGVDPRMAETMTIEQQVDKMALDFGWVKAVRDWVLSPVGLKCEKVDDFFYAVTSAAEWGPLMHNIKDINAVQQTARVRQSWVGLFSARKEQDELRKKRADSDDLDTLLAQGDLDTAQDRDWARYRQVWAPGPR